MKMHLNLATRDLDASVAFYSTLLGAKHAAKKLDDYALFITEQPGLELALDVDAARSLRRSALRYRRRFTRCRRCADRTLASAGYAIDIEREETCCYANQTKVWASDPEGRRWETYFVHDDTEERDRRRRRVLLAPTRP
jgi:catechol-2,3-dioxygenase